MSSQETKDLIETPEGSQTVPAQALPERTMNPATEGQEAAPTSETSKNALKKAAKKEKAAAEKANKSAKKGIGKPEAKHATSKAPKKKIENAALIGIDVAKEDDFAAWYQQVLLKGDMLEYYDVSGCFILKVTIVPGIDSVRRAVLTGGSVAAFILHLGGDPELVQ